MKLRNKCEHNKKSSDRMKFFEYLCHVPQRWDDLPK